VNRNFHFLDSETIASKTLAKSFFGHKILCAPAPLRETCGVPARFLLGPAGSGKTFRCLAEVRAALAGDPGGAPLVFLAPKQATFQLERQLLGDGAIAGYTRLHILSFDRLARFIFERLNVAPPKLLSAEGRVMVLRALLLRHEKELALFRQSARRPGFAQELAALLVELQQQQFTPAKLRALAGKKLRPELQAKLLDLALLLEQYGGWLKEHALQDADCLLDFAVAALKAESRIRNPEFRIENLWLDGFAEMTPQEMDLLAAFVPLCGRATLAFCLETEPAAEVSWLSIWSALGKTFQQCRARIDTALNRQSEVEILSRDANKSRFARSSALAAIEEGWSLPVQNPESKIRNPESLQITACANPEAEAVFAAREILKFVRAGNRFRDCAVLVRNLEAYHQPLARIFRRYEIPFFLDRRESVAHHPLAELTRGALRTAAFDWQHDDWFAALKAGFSPVDEAEIDRLENRALESGWRGKKWREPLPDESAERLRQQILPPFETLAAALAKTKFQPAGPQLAAALRDFWSDAKAETTLERWTLDDEPAATGGRQPAIHRTVWEQMNSWLDNLALAFAGEALPLRDWLPVLEAGLANLTVGVIPPALDEVLIGAVDRSRNPNLKFALVLGLNESVFPAAPESPAILTHSDRDELELQNAALGANRFDQLSRERYLGYIACTRAGEKLAVTFSRQSADGKTLNPSPFIARLDAMFPELKIAEYSGAGWREAEHANELTEPLATAAVNEHWRSLLELPTLKSLAENLAALREPDLKEKLPEALAEEIYGAVLKSSVSRLEEFAQCPFRFFVHSGLRAEERKLFELDARERGSFQHEILKTFHEQLQSEGKRWRDVEPAEARRRVGEIAAALAPHFRDGLLHADAPSRFAARMLTAALQDFVGTLVGWMRGQYDFDPAKAELDFGFDGSPAPAWKIDLGGGHRLALRGRIDRIDLCRDGDRALCVVTDYKSSQRKLDKILMEHGVQLQLPAYLAAVQSWPPEILGAGPIVPAGVFYVNLCGQFESGGSRAEALADADAARRLAYRHSGRFDASRLDRFDRVRAGDQLSYRLNQDGSVRGGSAEALPPAEFESLTGKVETQLRKLGAEIFSGAASVDPYRKGAATACDFCDYRAVCRIDLWTHPWRVLRAAPAASTPD
jgi:ATP-dependent helicase/nuclease subunit B